MGIAVPEIETAAHPFLRRAATLVVASAIPLSLVGAAATATADPSLPEISVQLPFAPAPGLGLVPAADPADPGALPPEVLPPAPPVSAGRNDLSVNRPMPDPNVLAPIDPQRLHLPNPAAPAPAVAPIEAPPGTLRVGSVVIGRPDFMTPEQGKMFNDAIAGPEAGIAQTLDSAGFDPSRSDRIAADLIGSTAIGASVGSMVAAPVASIGAVIGAICGAIAGLPMIPTGTIAVMAFGAAIGYGFVASPAIAVGAAVGAGVGVLQGLLTPPTVPAA
ncbi:hypothetical protein [Nocardia beijingensis]|uniref:hypothetical protein n=1 Tax=Nocardia beijingensis TaxID=95162 RepID=UPI0018944F2D|nr:hypothetical protein [Nocardia beijingensis]MBF6074846.1 hypothetical protein [Nocardia beijingensis]